MTSIGPYCQPMDFSHMYKLSDIRGPYPVKSYNPNSLMGYIASRDDMTRMSFLLRLAKLDGIYNDPQADFTLFVPLDTSLTDISDGVFINMDDCIARSIVQSLTLKRVIPCQLIEDSRLSKYNTMNQYNKIFIAISKEGSVFVNKDAKVIEKDIRLSNGMIHTIDKLIWPIMV